MALTGDGPDVGAPAREAAIRLVASRHVVRGAARRGDDQLSDGPAALEIRGATIAAVHDLPSGDGYRPALDRLAHSLRGQHAPPVEVDDLSDAIVTPAFVDAHVHLGLVALRGADIEGRSEANVVEEIFYRFESGLSADDVRALATLGAHEALLHGTGLVWEHYFHGEALADALATSGLPAVVAPTLQELGGPGVGRVERQLEATLNLHTASARPPVDDRAPIWAALGPHATDTIGGALWRRLGDLAEAHQLPVHAHLAQSIEEVRRVHAREGCSPAELLVREGLVAAAPTSLLVHGLFLTAAEVRALVTASGGRVRLGLCPRSQQIFGFVADPGRWEAAGAQWVLATDCAASNDALSLPHELATLAALRAPRVAAGATFARFFDGAAPETAADLAEQVHAERQRLHGAALAERAPASLLAHAWDVPGALHPRFRSGVLAAGALASLLVWDRDHPALWPAADVRSALVRASPEAAIQQIMTAGRWRSARGDHARSLAASAAYRDALTHAKGLLARLP